MKTIAKIFRPAEPHFVGDGFRVHNFIPSAADMQRMNPFLMLDYNSKHIFPPTDKPRGLSVHPHRGFETVTIAYKGRVEHHDSAGGGGIIGEGDVQWMTAARGVLHKEYHEREWSKSGGEFQMTQLWVNLPAAVKMSPPKYQAIAHSEIPRVPVEKGEIEVIAGQYGDISGRAETFTPIHLYNVRLSEGGSVNLEFPARFNTALVVIEGDILVNEVLAPADHFVLMNNDGTTFSVRASKDAVVLVLSGEPITEPIAAHGPFVMNTRQELLEAFEDYNAGKFGYLED